MSYTTIDDAAADFAEAMSLKIDEARDGLRAHRNAFGRWEELVGEERERVMRLVWSHATDDAAWPWGVQGG